MSKGREIADYLDDILTALSDLEDFTRGMYFETFSEDKKTINKAESHERRYYWKKIEGY